MEFQENESTFVRKEPCPSCGSKDNLGRYSDGHAYCFGCEYREPGGSEGDALPDSKGVPEASVNEEVQAVYLAAETHPLKLRGISEETCRRYGYRVGKLHDRSVQLAPYYRGNALVGLKVRDASKQFSTLGDMRKPTFFGSQLFSKGKMLVVTEGEIDCLTVSQVQGNKWPVISLPSGAPSAAKAFKNNLHYFDGFESVVLFFDMDEPGQKAAKECAELLPPGKAKVVHISDAKDANELLQQGRVQDIIQAIWNAKEYRPDGIISGKDLWESIATEDTSVSVDYPWGELNRITRGARKGELVTFTAGSGIGKSAVIREIAHHLITQGETVGMLMLEENTKRTALGLMGIELNKPLHLSREGVTEDELKSAFETTVGSGRLYLYDHWGSSHVENLLSRIRFLARGCGCSWIVLDHISIVVSGLGDGDERRLIDNLMTSLRTLVEETGVGMFIISHLKRPEGKGHEEGAQTSLSQLRGSAAIAQLSDLVVGLERSQQSETPNVTTLRVLKNRFSGETGVAGYLYYNRDTGRLKECDSKDGFRDETGGDSEF